MKKLFIKLRRRTNLAALFLKRTFRSGITRRWIFNIYGAIVFATIILVVLFCMFAQSNYYNMAESRLRTDARSVVHYYSNYSTSVPFDTAAHALVEDFEDKGLMELQISDIAGNTAVSSSGFPLNDYIPTPDLLQARQNEARCWVGDLDATGEKVMSYSVPLQDNYGNLMGTVRLLCSMEPTDDLLLKVFLSAILLGLGVILLTGFSGVYFIKSIVVPVAQINDTARAIAGGDMTKRIEKYSEDDELGHLCATINEMAAALGENEKIKNDFISSVSHELRTPLTAIRGWSETMIATQNEEIDPTTRRGIEVIYKETERLSKLVEELLDSSRIQNGRFKLMVAPMDLVAEFEDTVFMMMERAKLENVTIEYTPEVDTVEMLGDRNRLKQVFFNIIDNAIKHSHADGKVVTSLNVTDEAAVVTVSDNGEGISAADLPFVKQMFYKGHSQKRGSGIGLGVADQIVKHHSGTLTIESEEGKGTTVIISLPLKHQED